METSGPLILTLQLDTDSQHYFDELRERYFPPERNFLRAHLTLFHQLPANDRNLRIGIAEIAYEQHEFSMQVTDVVSIGRGVAYKVDSAKLQALHASMQRLWAHHLIPQDKQRLWPHITVQNKVDNATAAALSNDLRNGFAPFEIGATGLHLWEYLGGPWRSVQNFAFKLTADA